MMRQDEEMKTNKDKHNRVWEIVRDEAYDAAKHERNKEALVS
jgi:hypothetical protein